MADNWAPFVWYFLEDRKQFRCLRTSQWTFFKNKKVLRFMKGCIENDLKEQIFVIFSVKHIGFCNSSIEVLILPRAIQTNFSLRKLLNCSIFHFLWKQADRSDFRIPATYLHIAFFETEDNQFSSLANKWRGYFETLPVRSGP